MACQGGVAYEKLKSSSSSLGGRRLAVTGLILAFLGSLVVYRILDVTRTNLADQQRVVNSLLEVIKELDGDTALSGLDFSKSASTASHEMKTLVEELKARVEQGHLLAGVPSIRPLPKYFAPLDKVAEPGIAVVSLQKGGMFAASPSIVRLPTGRLLTVLELSVPAGASSTKLVYASDDDGITWAEVGTVSPMNWPQVFRCASGVYVIGTQRHFSPDNNLVISRMLDDDGAAWSEPVKLTNGWSVVTANVGVDISFGRVTKPFEAIPAMARPLITSTLRSNVTLPFSGGPRSSSWQHPPVLELPVESVDGFIPFTLIKAQAPDDEQEQTDSTRAFFFRILEVDAERQALVVRMERFNHYWADAPVVLSAGQTVAVRSGSSIYGGVDWVAMAMSADENADLTLPSSWSFSTPVGNPASVYANEMRLLFDVSFRPGAKVRESIVGAKLTGIKDNEEAYEAGFGSLYWMEGVVTRLRDRHGGSGKLLGIMRVNNDVMCDLAAVIEYDDSEFVDPSVMPNVSAVDGEALSPPYEPQFKARFLRYSNIPGLAVAHPSIVYDEASDLYWMVANANRDSMRRWKQPAASTSLNPRLNIAPFSKCEVDRSTLVLYYSPNQLDWMMAGVVDYHIRFGRHFTYPHMIIDDTDLLIVSRASYTPWSNDTSDRLPNFFNNHNSNAISFHRVRNFRALANVRWANEQGEYSGATRKSTNAVGSLVHTLLSAAASDNAGFQVATDNTNTNSTELADDTTSPTSSEVPIGGRRMLADGAPDGLWW